MRKRNNFKDIPVTLVNTQIITDIISSISGYDRHLRRQGSTKLY